VSDPDAPVDWRHTWCAANVALVALTAWGLMSVAMQNALQQ